jgi:hypothetical protein
MPGMVVPMENSFFEGGDDLDQDDLLKTLQGYSTLMLNVPFRSDESTNDHLRLAKDFLVAPFVGERLAPHCKAIRFMSIRSGPPQRAMISFSFVPGPGEGMAVILSPQNGATCYQPILIEVEVPCHKCETAWGAVLTDGTDKKGNPAKVWGNQFPGKNWATYLEYQVAV